MTLEDYFGELAGTSLKRMKVDLLERLYSFTPTSPLDAADERRLDEARRRIRDEIARRAAADDRIEETAFRRRERQAADRHHNEHVAQSGRMHVAHMEKENDVFVRHRMFMWLAVGIAFVSALLAWGSLWRQRDETRRALESIKKRVDKLEAREAKSPPTNP